MDFGKVHAEIFARVIESIFIYEISHSFFLEMQEMLDSCLKSVNLQKFEIPRNSWEVYRIWQQVTSNCDL